MRKMMLAATVMLAACGAVEDMAADDGSDDFGDAGTGSGDDTPTSCTTAADCGNGRACDIARHECVTGSLTIEPTDEVVADGAQWWTSVADPVLRGTFSGPTGAEIVVTAGSGQAVSATMQGNTWSAKLGAGAITSAGTNVSVVMTDPSGGHVELVQQLTLDAVAPQISLAPSKVRDERGDTIDFSSGEPVHTHAGAEIDLGANGCPSVYKYAYLMDAQNPTFGSQASQNPLAWNFSIADAKIASASYRVRNAQNQVLLDWTAVMAGTSGLYRVDARRDAIAQLGSYTGQLTIDVRARDWTGLETTFSRCIDFHPLAAPLEIGMLQPVTTSLATTPGLFGMSLPADSPVSDLAGYVTMGANVVSQRVVQYTNEPIHVTIEGSLANLRIKRTYVDDYVPVATAPGSACGAGCAWNPPADPPELVFDGAATSWALVPFLIDEATSSYVTTYPLVIPPRAANEAPHAYRVALLLGQLSDLRVGAAMPNEVTLNNITYTGYAPSGPSYACSAKVFENRNGVLQEVCTQTTTYKRIVALDQARILMDNAIVDLRTSPSAAVPASVPANVPASTFAAGALTWDSGNDDLPGVH